VERKSRRLYWLWGIALTLLLGLALFCWLVVVPVWQVRRVTQEFATSGFRDGYFSSSKQAAPHIEDLGGAGPGARKLALYLRAPRWVEGAHSKGHAYSTYVLLAYCGKDGLAELVGLLEDGREYERQSALLGLMVFGVNYKRTTYGDTVSCLEPLLEDDDPEVRELGAKAIELIKSKYGNPSLPK